MLSPGALPLLLWESLATAAGSPPSARAVLIAIWLFTASTWFIDDAERST